MVGVRASPTHQSNYKIMQKTFKGASMPKNKLDAYGVGLMRLHEVSVASVNLSHEDIEHIGQCSINRKKVVIGKIGNFWCIYGRTELFELKVKAQYGKDSKFKACYIVQGKRVTTLHPGTGMSMNDFECRELSKPLNMMSTDEIFQAGKGKRCQKHGGKANSHADIGKYKNKPSVSMNYYGY